MGLLGEDRSQEFTKSKFMDMEPSYNLENRQNVHLGIAKFKAELEAAKARTAAQARLIANSPKILVAVASKGGGLVNQHFGHAKEFMIYE